MRLTPSIALLAALTLAPAARAAPPERPKVIIFGGGWGPEANQASIEQHVESLAQALSRAQPVVLFAGGPASPRSVQIPAKEADRAGDLLGMVFGRRDALDVDYRPPRVATRAAATKVNLLAELARTATRTSGVIVFGAGHGSPSDDDKPAQLDLWGGPDDALAVDELARELDEQDRTGPTAFVLGQCHSGAFAALLRAGGAADGTPAAPARCVLAAIPPDREAAGCTPDIATPGARAYLALIADAFRRPAESDHDRDGRVTLFEAHAYASIHDATIDVPVTSSEAWLRDTLGKQPRPGDSETLDAIAKRARPAVRAVIGALRTKELSGPTVRLAQLRKAFDDASRDLGAADEMLRPLEGKVDQLRGRLKEHVLDRWPELANPYHRVSRQLLAGNAEPVVAFISQQPELNEIRVLDQEIAQQSDELLVLERSTARLERLLRAADDVVLEEALRKRKKKAEAQVLDRLLACEALSPL